MSVPSEICGSSEYLFISSLSKFICIIILVLKRFGLNYDQLELIHVNTKELIGYVVPGEI